ncbi:hypothetical protein [Clostridium sp.]|uniref:hypothetical protein n=1 Tax=Clostridium sp. TaxID=1506 RepID=UPI00261A379C|nr:hypothetical protein [Clostridium sp.]
MQNNIGNLLEEKEKNKDLKKIKLKNILEEINRNADNILIRFFGEKGKEKSDPKELNLYGFRLEDIDLVNEMNDVIAKNSKDFISMDIFKDIEEEINNIMDLCYEKDNIRNLKSFNIESYFNEYLEKNVLYTCEEKIDELPEKVSTIVLDIEEALIDYAKKDIINLLNSLHSIKEKIKQALAIIEDNKNIDN